MTHGGFPDQNPPAAGPPPGFGPPVPVPPQAPYGPPQPGGYGPPPPQPYPYGQPAPPQPYGGPANAEDPEFIAHDRTNSVVVDASGVALEIQGHTVEFPWAQIRTVHYAPAPYGTVLMVAVAHVGGHLYECRITARRKALLQEWLEEVAPVVHFYLSARPPVY
ncbi:hypothetical protein [Streptomyces wuyuanensis]|uniref:Uncharacterized protein n=1 Tax=Streptomyces wuyuanensis TaxID=1196353 RepID=A0A1G9NYR6_9ACTN|nr:hypothetical protein [Streptomyces wuyuanensis]SDL91530.1 hypothetical protein SAMN05444921_102179 [Streptomyces wuyuanensis]